MKAQRKRFWLETGSAVTTGFLAVLTLVQRRWIESAFGIDPDRHSGSLEWLVVAAFVAMTCTLAAAARAEWRPQRMST